MHVPRDACSPPLFACLVLSLRPHLRISCMYSCRGVFLGLVLSFLVLSWCVRACKTCKACKLVQEPFSVACSWELPERFLREKEIFNPPDAFVVVFGGPLGSRGLRARHAYLAAQLPCDNVADEHLHESLALGPPFLSADSG